MAETEARSAQAVSSDRPPSRSPLRLSGSGGRRTAPELSTQPPRGAVPNHESARHPRRIAAVIATVGLALTAATALAAARVDRNTEQRLLEGQTRQAATVLTTAIMVIQQPLDATLAAQRASQPAHVAEPFRQVMATQVGPGKAFQSASLWRRHDGRLERLASVGAPAAMRPRGAETLAYLRNAFDSKTTTVRLVTVGDRSEIAYARADPGSGWLVYAERTIPADRRATVDRDSAFSQLHYAIYLGRETTSDALSTTDVDPGTLPFDGVVARETVPFGDTVLTLTTTPRGRLGSDLSGGLPWMLLFGGLLLTLIAARVGQRLARDRQTAEEDAATITTLYQHTETLYAQQHELFANLQRALLPNTRPELPNLEVAAEYVAGAHGLDIGGDWFSIMELDEGRFGFVVGDVSGRGIDAVAVMARARFTIRAYLRDGDDPAVVLQKCSQQFDIMVDGHMTTALVGVGDWRSGEVTLASAGHPPPVLLSDAGATLVDVSPGRPLGAGLGPYPPTTFTMPPGATLFCFTDGLVERRGEDIDIGLDRLAGVLSAASDLPVDELVRHALNTLRHHDAPDDIATLALRWTGAP
jgi:serine phosphatase RsbU (regulator of sigma subunit)